MSKDEELFRLGTAVGGDPAANRAAFGAWQQTQSSNALVDSVLGGMANRMMARNLEEFAENQHKFFRESLYRIKLQLQADLEEKKAELIQRELMDNYRREAMELEQTAIRDLLLEEIDAGRLERDAVNAIYQEELQITRDQLVEAMQDDPEYAATLEADIALIDERLNRAIDDNAYADENEFIHAHGELPTWPVGRPAPKDYQHPGPLMRVQYKEKK